MSSATSSTSGLPTGPIPIEIPPEAASDRVRRTRAVRTEETPLLWVMLDNLRLGVTYAAVLEAFKLGT